ncbi:glycine cleavage system protein R [Adhaeretor mobilis]|uniref:Glycine cleavage system transcriptional repressor n=1 Tax=Adhaeretor mobilis TaxID=1930276 RepID=A0A517N1N1_9BACT|nr:ACT domain-containing protein [Adhaeretor mobilis]QDT01044.1 Glycine cleavage system transcriptional repressor [Adhaeretor mobilis]
MSQVTIVATLIGEDRPGLVEQIAEQVNAHGGNWVESRMAHLAGQFAGILRVEVEEAQVEALQAALAKLKAAGLDTIVHAESSATTQTAEVAQLEAPSLQLELVGHDRPGIVREVTSVLARLGVNVEELNTERTAAANTGQPLFNAAASLRLPAGVSRGTLQAALEEVAGDLMVDIQLVASE